MLFVFAVEPLLNSDRGGLFEVVLLLLLLFNFLELCGGVMKCFAKPLFEFEIVMDLIELSFSLTLVDVNWAGLIRNPNRNEEGCKKIEYPWLTNSTSIAGGSSKMKS